MGNLSKWLGSVPDLPGRSPSRSSEPLSADDRQKTPAGRSAEPPYSKDATRPLRILILEDRAADAELMVNELRDAGLDVTWTRVDTQSGFAAALEDPPDVVLADYSVPGFGARDALALLQAQHPDIPLIIVTGTLGDEAAAEGIRLGAADYILKDRPARLAEAVRIAVERRRLVLEQQWVDENLRESEARFRSFMENWAGRASIRDTECRYKFVNAAWLKVVGLDEAQVLDRTPEELFPPERAASLRQIHRQVLESGSPVSHVVQRSDQGTMRSWLFHHFPIADARGKVAFVGAVGLDVSEQKEQESRIRRLNRIYAVMSGINSAIVRARDKIELFKEACRIAVEHGKFGLAWIGLLDPATLDVVPVTWEGLGSEEMKRSPATARADLPQGQGVLGRAVRGRRPEFDNDISLTRGVGGKRREEALRLGYRSLIVLPLYAEGDVAGVMALFAKEPDFFNDEELKLLTELAANVSFALDHFAGRQRIEKLQRVRAVTSAVNTAIIRSESRKALFDEACRIAVESGGFGIAWIGTLDPKTLDISPVASAGIDVDDFIATVNSSARADHPLGQGVAGRAARERSAAVDNDLLGGDNVTGTRHREALRRGYQSRIALPLMTGNEVFGVLVLYAKEKDFFSGEELHLLNELAGNISFALDNMAKQEKIGKLSRIRAVLSETNVAIARIRDRDALLHETCRIAVEHGKFDFVWIAACDEAKKQVRPVAWRGFSDEAAHGVNWATIESSRGTIGEAVRSRRPVIRADIETGLTGGALRKEALERGKLSTACIPLLDGERVVGLFNLFAPGRGFFDTEELSLLEELTADVSLALQAISRREEVEYLSYYDALTGLPNRTLFLDRAGQQLRARGGESLKVALIVLNLERFRNVNESFGRHGGDQLLKLISARLEAAFRGKDYLARIGADSFGVIIRGVPDAQLVMHAVENQVLGCFREPFELDGNEVHVSAKAGIALFPGDGPDPDSLFRNAEAALKKTRDAGERYLFYSADMNARASQVLSLESRLRRAVEARQFVLHYQPKVFLPSRKVCGFEALIRWEEPGKGLVPPGAFIPLLEETGLILPVGEWAIAQALRDHKKWTERGLVAPRIAVNVSAIQLQQRQFSDMVITTLQDAGASPSQLELEITESLLMKDIEASIRKLTILRGLGVHIAMDDFGTGYSSLSYIARLPIDSVKIDRAFIAGMSGNPQDMSIVTTIIALAHSLNLRVIAEGVETVEQSKLLALLKCDEGQGYLFSKPLPEAEACKSLESPAGFDAGKT
jgi:diguanylate cyclase (GGDEF)-like protein/PAS domain S-box-containing protein